MDKLDFFRDSRPVNYDPISLIRKTSVAAGPVTERRGI